MIRVKKINETYLKIFADTSILYELRDSPDFSFFAEGYRFHPKFKRGQWDGKIRLFHIMTRQMYVGLLPNLLEWAKQFGYKVELEGDFDDFEVSREECQSLIDEIEELPFKSRDHQFEAVYHCLKKNRALILAATGSGKSLSIYVLTKIFAEQRILIITPKINLINQLASDFDDYGNTEPVGKIAEGSSKNLNERVVISTWQSIYKQPEEWYDQFDVIIGDEAHSFKAKSLISIMENAKNVKYRFGFSGTLDGSVVNKLVLEGLFGQVERVVSTAELIEADEAAIVNIKNMILQYPDEVRKTMARCPFENEMKFLLESQLRNDFIMKLATSLKGNTLVLFTRIDSQGKLLYNSLKSKVPEDQLFYVAGSTKGDERERIRKKIDTMTQSLTLASVVWIEGTNIPNIDNIIFTYPYKSQTKVLQALGRGVRKSSTKTHFNLYDICDDLTWGKWTNYTMNMAIQRMKLYAKERLPFKQITIKLGNE